MKRVLSLLVALLAIAIVLLLLRQPHEVTAWPPISDDCVTRLAIQERLGELAVRGMQVFGRIDPGLYQVTQDDKKEGIALAPGVEPIEPGNGDARQAFNNLLSQINADPDSARTFIEAHGQAARNCEMAGCDAKRYSVQVKEASIEHNEPAKYFRFEVSGEQPSPTAWDAFTTQYAARLEPGCSFAPALHLARGDGAEAASPSDRSVTTLSLKTSPKTSQPSTGYADTSSFCVPANPANSCKNASCTLADGKTRGHPKYDHSTWCCVLNCG